MEKDVMIYYTSTVDGFDMGTLLLSIPSSYTTLISERWGKKDWLELHFLELHCWLFPKPSLK